MRDSKYTASGIDHEARWVKMGNENRFGFKYHVLTDINSWMKGGCARYRGRDKTHTQGVLEFIACNIKRTLCLPIRERLGIIE